MTEPTGPVEKPMTAADVLRKIRAAPSHEDNIKWIEAYAAQAVAAREAEIRADERERWAERHDQLADSWTESGKRMQEQKATVLSDRDFHTARIHRDSAAALRAASTTEKMG